MTGYPVLNCSVRKSLRLSPLFVFLLLIFARLPVAQASDYRSLHEPSALPKVVAWRQSPARKTGSDSLVSQSARELTMLETGTTFERELSGEQKHEYQITLAGGQYASVIVEQNAQQHAGARIAPEVTTLKLGTPIDRELTGGQKHSYQLSLAQGQYGSVTIDQMGIDIVAHLFAGDEQLLADVDSEKTTQGSEKIEVVADVAGNYKIEIEPSLRNAGA